MQTPPVGNLKERIAALQQRSVSPQSQPSHHSASVSKPSSPNNHGSAGSLRSKIAKFESKGGVPIPRGSFGLGAPPEGAHNTSRELYGNRIPSVNKPGSGSISRSGSPLPSVDDSPGTNGRKRRESIGAFDSPVTPLDLSQKLAFQRNLDILNGTPVDTSFTSESERSPSPSPSPATTGNGFIGSSRRNSLVVLGAGRRNVSSSVAEYVDSPSSPLRPTQSIGVEGPVAPSIVISPESSFASPGILDEDSQIVDEPAGLFSDTSVSSSGSVPASPSSPAANILPSLLASNYSTPNQAGFSGSESRHSPLTSPVSPTSRNGTIRSGSMDDEPTSPRNKFPSGSVPTSPVQAPQPERLTSNAEAITAALQPTRSSSLAAAPLPSRSPSPTPSMIHQPDAPEATEAPTLDATRAASKSNNRRQHPGTRCTIAVLPANPPPAPDNEEGETNFGVVTLAADSGDNPFDAATKTKSGFTAVVHQKVKESPMPSTARPPIVPTTPQLRRTIQSSDNVVPPSPGYGDLATLLEEAALLEERLMRNENGTDIAQEMEKMHGSDPDGFQLQPFSLDSNQEMYADELQDQVPPPPPPKGLPRVLSGIKRLASSASQRSKGSHSRISTSGSELSSEDSASVGTPSDNGIAFPAARSNGSLDRHSVGGSSALGIGYPSPRKNGRSLSRASSFAEKIWHRTRSRSNVSSAGTLLSDIFRRGLNFFGSI